VITFEGGRFIGDRVPFFSSDFAWPKLHSGLCDKLILGSDEKADHFIACLKISVLHITVSHACYFRNVGVPVGRGRLLK